jgi:glycosyltransferase involved in cell wall biosynthesis
MNPSCTLVISTYNRPSALRLCLASVLEQTRLPDEIVIADDGSTQETKDLVVEFTGSTRIPVQHVWQADEGFRLAAIRNKAFVAATSDYIIQIDGDLILHPKFIKDHLAACKRRSFIAGTRVLIGPELTEQLVRQGKYSWQEILNSKLKKKHYGKRSRLVSAMFYHTKKGKRYVPYVLGCNMAFWKADLEKVNGYNEEFTGWGKEDNDIAARLLNAGVQLHSLKFRGVAYHLYHKEAAQHLLTVNEKLYEATLVDQLTYIRKGLDQYVKH